MLNTVKRWDAYCALFTLWDIGWAGYDLVMGHLLGVFFFVLLGVLMVTMWYKFRPGIAETEAANKAAAARRAAWLEEVCKRDY
jgi:hypothetical protein